MNTGGRSGRRVALTETRKAGTAKINANTVQAKAEKTMEAAMPTIAGHITPKMVHPQHRVVYDGTLAGLNS